MDKPFRMLPLFVSLVTTIPLFSAEQHRIPIERLEYGLCLTFWEPKIWGWGEHKMDPREEARLIHERLTAAVKKKQQHNGSVDFESIGKSLDKKYDAIIVHQCAVLEKRKRQTGTVGFIRVPNMFFYGFPTRLNAEPFYENACIFDDFYQTLTDDELDRLIRGTQPKNFIGRVWNKIKGNEAYM